MAFALVLTIILRLQPITYGAGQHLTNEVPETRHLTLQSYLIKPVQRICKYPLLVRVRPVHAEPAT